MMIVKIPSEDDRTSDADRIAGRAWPIILSHMSFYPPKLTSKR